MLFQRSWVLLMLAACGEAEECAEWFVDADGDGIGAGVSSTTCDAPSGSSARNGDCNDSDPAILPGQLEVCNEVDDDCDGDVDDNVIGAEPLYEDLDGDGYGSAIQFPSCEGGPGRSSQTGDCNDADQAILPGAAETCNGTDDDCDGLTDDADPDRVVQSTLFEDADGDGFAADSAIPATSCEDSAFMATDCDDTDPGRAPGQVDVCDGVDNDCDDLIDGNDPTFDPSQDPIWYPDLDGDGFGNPVGQIAACLPPAFFVSDATDCNDLRPDANPDAPEVCDDLDNDCDLLANDLDPSLDVSTQIQQWDDIDGDGFGDDAAPFLACEVQPGAALTAGDCDDLEPLASPNGLEVPYDGIDGDCDPETYDDDLDQDGFGFGADCADLEAAVNPSAAETCNAVDDDCDDLIDALDPSLAGIAVFVDFDEDGYGNPDLSVVSCDDAEHSLNGEDCADAMASINPGVLEQPYNGLDDDCSPGSPDDDLDGDGLLAALDCNDLNPDIGAGADEVCDGLDNDCDGLWDEEDGDLIPDALYADLDGDGLGDPDAPISGCPQDHRSALPTDCDDGDPLVLVGPPWSLDADHDGAPADGFVEACAPPGADWISTGPAVDCNDGDAAISPTALEVCADAIDDNCDGFDALCHEPASILDLDDAELIIYSSDLEGQAGTAVANAGDLNADGIDDLIVGLPLDDQPGTDGGIARTFDGGRTGVFKFSSSEGKLLGVASLDQAGRAVAGLGDIDGDGLGDVATGAEFADVLGSNDGAIYISLGPIAGEMELSAAQALFHGDDDGDNAGEFMVPVADADGNGTIDLLVGVPKAVTAEGDGTAHLILTPASGTFNLGDADAVIFGNGDLGHGLYGGSDLDGDGLAEIVVGAPFLMVDGLANSGASYVIASPVVGEWFPEDVSWTTEGDSDSFYGWTSHGGDLNGDGYGDLATSARDGKVGIDEVGITYLLDGTTPLDGRVDPAGATAFARVFGEANGDRAGASLATTDHNGDGQLDLIVGADQFSGSNDGKVYMIYGPLAGDIEAADADRKMLGDNTDQAGTSVSAIDYDHDGYGDIAIGAPMCDRDKTNAGCVYIVFGSDF